MTGQGSSGGAKRLSRLWPVGTWDFPGGRRKCARVHKHTPYKVPQDLRGPGLCTLLSCGHLYPGQDWHRAGKALTSWRLCLMRGGTWDQRPQATSTGRKSLEENRPGQAASMEK